MVRGRRPKKIPLDYVKMLHEQGYSPALISWKLWHEFGIDVSRWTIWRRLRDMGVNFATKSGEVCHEKPGVIQ